MKNYRIAGVTIGIDALNDDVHERFRDYTCDGSPDFTVETSQSDIDLERSKSDGGNYTDSYIESLAAFRKIAERLPKYDAFLIHGSCVSVDGEGYIFTAPSGTGKSTHSALWCRLLGDRAVMVNDDKPIIRLTDGKAIIYGTPFNGKHGRGRNIHVPLRAVCILERSEVNNIHEISGDEAYITLIRQTYRPGNPEALTKTIGLLDRLREMVKFYSLGCNMDIEAAEVSYNMMKG